MLRAWNSPMQLQKHSERTGGLGISRSGLETDLCSFKDNLKRLEGSEQGIEGLKQVYLEG